MAKIVIEVEDRPNGAVTIKTVPHMKMIMAKKKAGLVLDSAELYVVVMVATAMDQSEMLRLKKKFS